jgi:hypothetical protein
MEELMAGADALIGPLARRFARRAIEAQLRARGVFVQWYPYREIDVAAREYLALHRAELYRRAEEALAKYPHLLPKRLRRPVSRSDHAQAGTEIVEEKSTTSAIFKG